MFLDLVLLFYILFLILLILKWNQKTTWSSTTEKISATVIIPFRNEEQQLNSTISSILKQENADELELILINDHSTDNSLEIAENWAKNDSRIKVVSLQNAYGKKEALALGISMAKNSWILQTDADCEVPKHWYHTMCSSVQENSRLLLGPIMAKNSNTKYAWFNQLECLILQVITAGSAGYNNAQLSNGANLLYQKEDYLGYLNSGIGKEYSSGDDYFLMLYIKKNLIDGVQYVKNKQAIVQTGFPSDWEEMLTQRTRWAKKVKPEVSFSSFLIYLAIGIHFVSPILIILSIFGVGNLYHALSYWALKTLIETLVIYYADQFFRTHKIRKTLNFAILYPLFLFQILLRLNKEIKWKNRPI